MPRHISAWNAADELTWRTSLHCCEIVSMTELGPLQTEMHASGVVKVCRVTRPDSDAVPWKMVLNWTEGELGVSIVMIQSSVRDSTADAVAAAGANVGLRIGERGWRDSRRATLREAADWRMTSFMAVGGSWVLHAATKR